MQASGMMADEMDEPDLETRRHFGIWILIIIVAGILILGDLNQSMRDTRRLEQDARVLETEVASLATQNARVGTQIAEATSEEGVRAWAHGEGGMVQEGEVLVVPFAPGESGNPPTPAPEAIQEPPSNWEVWRALLFGE